MVPGKVDVVSVAYTSLSILLVTGGLAGAPAAKYMTVSLVIELPAPLVIGRVGLILLEVSVANCVLVIVEFPLLPPPKYPVLGVG